MSRERYFVLVNGDRLGPFTVSELSALHAGGSLTGEATVAPEPGGPALAVASLLTAAAGSPETAASAPPESPPRRERRVDLYQRIGENRANSTLLLLSFIMLLTLLGLAGGLALGTPFLGVLAALFLAVAIVLFAYYQGDQAILAMSGAREVRKEENPYLCNTIEGLSLAAGLPQPKAYLIPSAAPNAFATGRDPDHASVAVTKGLLDKLDRLELEGVLAHEMAHVGNHDIRLALLVTGLVGSVVLLADWIRNLFRLGFDFDNDDEGSGPARLVGLVVALFLALISPLMALLLQAAISRQREFLADAEGVRLTRYPEGLASALEKIARDKVALHVANKATAHLFVVNPLFDHKGVVNSLFNTHPATAERIKRLRAM